MLPGTYSMLAKPLSPATSSLTPDSQDDVLPGDDKVTLDADDIRETKKARSAATAQRGKDSSLSPAKSTGISSNGGGAGRPGSAWNGFGAGGGAAGAARGSGGGRGGVIGGMRRLPGTKQEALRSKGLFKIAPASKVGTFSFCFCFLAA